jgi:hypothetical protein
MDYMVRCIDCNYLYTRDDEYTTHFCLHNRDYVDDIDKETACGHFTPLWEKKRRMH